jgi:23S rRNA pseudouridine955/2504/2580 synthase
LKSNTEFSLLEVELLTGRTHQIRVHLAHAGYPIVGDDKYGDFALNRRLRQRLLLHAAKLAFRHPASGEPVKLESPLPPEMRAFVDKAFA